MVKYNVIGEAEWACDDVRGYFGYSVHWDNGIWPEYIGFPAFTHEQMLECQRIQDRLGAMYGFDSYGKLEYRDGIWLEMYLEDGEWVIEDELRPIHVDGLELYELGGVSDWAWGQISDGFEYQTV